MIPALTLVLVFHGHLLLCRSWRPCDRFIRAGANDRWNLNLLLKNDHKPPKKVRCRKEVDLTIWPGWAAGDPVLRASSLNTAELSGFVNVAGPYFGSSLRHPGAACLHVAAFVLAQFMAGFIYGVEPWDPVVNVSTRMASFRADWRRAGATSPLCSPGTRLWTALQIRAVATARFVNRLIGVKPGIRFQISTRRVPGQSAASCASSFSLVNCSLPLSVTSDAEP